MSHYWVQGVSKLVFSTEQSSESAPPPCRLPRTLQTALEGGVETRGKGSPAAQDKTRTIRGRSLHQHSSHGTEHFLQHMKKSRFRHAVKDMSSLGLLCEVCVTAVVEPSRVFCILSCLRWRERRRAPHSRRESGTTRAPQLASPSATIVVHVSNQGRLFYSFQSGVTRFVVRKVDLINN